MTEEKHKIDDEVNPHGLADHKALRKMGTERLKELLDQTYEMRKNRLKSTPSASPSVNHYIDEWITVVPLSEMAQASRDRQLIRTTLYIVSPALAGGTKRSRLYAPDHDHLFRPNRSGTVV